jgi:hypothetical protein
MTDQHSITPPLEMRQLWVDLWHQAKVKHVDLDVFVAIQAARWGWDQRSATVPAELQQARDEELEACVAAVYAHEDQPLCGGTAEWLRSARRPKPLSLKEQALRLVSDYGVPFYRYTAEQTDIIRRALEQLND